MSTKGRGYNPRHSLPTKKINTEEPIQKQVDADDEDFEYSKEALKLEDIPVVNSDKISNDLGENVNEKYEEENAERNAEENIDEFIEEIHQEVINNGFKEEEILRNEQELVDQLNGIIGNKGESESYKRKDQSREDIPDIVIPKGIRTREIYEKEFNNFAEKVIQTVSKNNEHKTGDNHPVYKFKVNEQTGKIERVDSLDDEEVNKVSVDVNKLEIVGNMLKTANTDATKLEVEIFIYEEIIKDEFDSDKIQNYQRKIDTLKGNLEFVNKKINILLKLLN